MVPWTTREGTETVTYERYYHLFKKGELEDCVLSAGGKVLESGYERVSFIFILLMCSGQLVGCRNSLGVRCCHCGWKCSLRVVCYQEKPFKMIENHGFFDVFRSHGLANARHPSAKLQSY
jgi:hypothetical protein